MEPESKSSNPYAPPVADVGGPLEIAGLSASNIRRIAKAQRQLLGGVGLLLLVGFVGTILIGVVAGAARVKPNPLAITALTQIVVWGLRLVCAFLCYRLAEALGSRSAWGWAIVGGIFVIIAAAVLSSRASKRLREAGVKVGFLGPRLDALPPE